MPPFATPISKFWKSPNFLTVALIAALCSASYLFSIWQHSGRVPTSSSLLLPSHSTSTACTNLSSSSTTTTRSTTTTTITLDFAAHHTADEAALAADGASPTRYFPPCDAEHGEYTPCEDRRRSLRFPREKLEYRERHCPAGGELLKCLVPAPPGYRQPFPWPESREWAWFANVPHTELAVEKGVQNWIRVQGDRFRFPGGGTMFSHGADAYIDDLARLIPLADGSIRTAIDTGCGVASWGAYLLSRNILTMSFAPRDTHEAQVQFALERGVPAMLGVLAVHRLPYPSRAFDMAHCSRCLIPWHLYDGLYLMEIDRILRPGGYWILSGPPINWKRHWKGWKRTKEDLGAEQSTIESIAWSLCWKKVTEKGDIAIWQKPINHMHCKASRKVIQSPEFCQAQDPDAAWYTRMESCITPLPEVAGMQDAAGGEIRRWPERLTAMPPRISSGSISGVTPEMFWKDCELWTRRIGYYKKVVNQLAQRGQHRNLLDMNSGLGGFAAALINDPVWVMNTIPNIAKVNTLGVIYERGLIGTYQDWCEALSTYPRTYDLIHADSVFSLYKDRCEMEDILLEMDRILRPDGTMIFRDDIDILVKIKRITGGMKWSSQIVDHEDGPLQREKLLIAVKAYWTASDQDQEQSIGPAN